MIRRRSTIRGHERGPKIGHWVCFALRNDRLGFHERGYIVGAIDVVGHCCLPFTTPAGPALHHGTSLSPCWGGANLVNFSQTSDVLRQSEEEGVGR